MTTSKNNSLKLFEGGIIFGITMKCSGDENHTVKSALQRAKIVELHILTATNQKHVELHMFQ